jgi:hypothetical protein
VARELSREEIRRLARLGAERRLQELRKEEAAIRAAFPDLDEVAPGRGRRRGRPRKADNDTIRTVAAKRRRPKMSAAQRRAVSERMKRYWAARRKAKG